MLVNNDIRIRTVHSTGESTFTHETTNTHFHVVDYDVYFDVRGNDCYVPMQITSKNGEASEAYLMTAYLDNAMVAYYKVSLGQMGKKRDKNRQELAKKILALALKKLGG